MYLGHKATGIPYNVSLTTCVHCGATHLLTTLASLISHFAATKVHMALRRLALVTWIRDDKESVDGFNAKPMIHEIEM